MATGWIKSLQCKSKALDDVAHHHQQPNPKYHHSLSNLASCRNSFQNLKDIVETTKKSKPKKPKPPKPHPPPLFKRPVSRKLEPDSSFQPTIRTRSNNTQSLFPSLTELPKDHPSRNVVEIIFHSSWGERNFSGRVEMVFKVQNLTRTLNRFEEYRAMVKHRASCEAACDGGEDHVRCIADGNEVMRFYCLGATTTGGPYETGCGAWTFQGCKKAVVCTYSGSGVAHENAGGGRGRRAMLVCRVIAGRVCKQLGFDSLLQEGIIGYDSVSGENGELLVFDTRALLPCFLIIYKL